MNNQGCCAHITVRYDPIHYENGTNGDRWTCQTCGSEFAPRTASPLNVKPEPQPAKDELVGMTTVAGQLVDMAHPVSALKEACDLHGSKLVSVTIDEDHHRQIRSREPAYECVIEVYGVRVLSDAALALLDGEGVEPECLHEAWEENGGSRKCIDCGQHLPAPHPSGDEPQPAVDEDPECDAEEGSWCCTLKAGHAGPHAAHGTQDGAKAYRIWPAEPQPDKRGVYEKFRIERTDGRSAPGEKHHGCRYFVLDLDHDKHAPPALRAYAESCGETHPQLAAELEEVAGQDKPTACGDSLEGFMRGSAPQPEEPDPCQESRPLEASVHFECPSCRRRFHLGKRSVDEWLQEIQAHPCGYIWPSSKPQPEEPDPCPECEGRGEVASGITNSEGHHMGEPCPTCGGAGLVGRGPVGSSPACGGHPDPGLDERYPCPTCCPQGEGEEALEEHIIEHGDWSRVEEMRDRLEAVACFLDDFDDPDPDGDGDWRDAARQMREIGEYLAGCRAPAQQGEGDGERSIGPPCGHSEQFSDSQLHGVCIFCYRDRLGAAVAKLKEARAPLPCGHPAACAAGGVTRYCGWCAELEAIRSATPPPDADAEKLALDIEKAQLPYSESWAARARALRPQVSEELMEAIEDIEGTANGAEGECWFCSSRPCGSDECQTMRDALASLRALASRLAGGGER
jgi:hypothetical protein